MAFVTMNARLYSRAAGRIFAASRLNQSRGLASLPKPVPPAARASQGSGFWNVYSVGAGAVATGAAAVYFVPVFEETRKGVYLAWNYPYEVLFKDSYSESAWLIGIGGLTGLGAAFAFVRAVGSASGGRGSFLVGIPRTVLAMFTGIVTFSVTMQLGPYVLPPAQRTVKLIMYTMDGLMADLAGRYEGDPPIWEKQDGITVGDVQRYMAHEASQRAAVQAGAAEQQSQRLDSEGASHPVPPLSTLDFAAVEARVAAATTEKVELSSELRDRHRTLLVSELLRLRREEELLRNQLSAKRAAIKQLKQSTDHDYLGGAANDLQKRVDAVEERKAQLKQRAQEVHGASLTGLCEAEVFVMAHGLEELRERQLSMALQARELGKFEAMVVKKELRKMDATKRELKRSAADAFGVRISHKAKSVTPWRRALAGIPDA